MERFTKPGRIHSSSSTDTLTAAVSSIAVANPMTTVGDTLYADTGSTVARVAGNTTTTKKFLNQTGDGATTPGAPAWSAITATDLATRYSTSGGVKNAYTATPSAAIAAYVAGQEIHLLMATASNDAAATLAVSGLGTKPIVTKANAALSGGELVNGTMYILVYDGTSFRILA